MISIYRLILFNVLYNILLASQKIQAINFPADKNHFAFLGGAESLSMHCFVCFRSEVMDPNFIICYKSGNKIFPIFLKTVLRSLHLHAFLVTRQQRGTQLADRFFIVQ